MSFFVSSSNDTSAPPPPPPPPGPPPPGASGSFNGSVTSLGISPTMAPTTPVPAPYVSPGALVTGGSHQGKGAGLPPPFSLGPATSNNDSPETSMHSGAGGSLTAYPQHGHREGSGGGGNRGSNNSNSTSAVIDPQQQALLSAALPPGAGRGGTDPTKFKTTICRNWEQTGTCQFRGCTFAHGVEDLRPPTKLIGVTGSPALNNVPQSTMQQLMTGNSPQTGSAPLKIEQIAELLVTEVNRQRDLVTVHMEANRTLENMLKREIQLKGEAAAQLEAARAEIAHIRQVNTQKDQEIQQLSGMAESEGKKTLDSFVTNFQNKSPKIGSSSATTTNVSSPGMPTSSLGGGSAGFALPAANSSPAADAGASYSFGASAGSGSDAGASGLNKPGKVIASKPPNAGNSNGIGGGDYVTPPDGSPTATDDQLRNILSGLNISS